MKRQFFHKANRSFSQRADALSRTPADIIGVLLCGVVLILIVIRIVAPGVFIAIVTPGIAAGQNLTASVGEAAELRSASTILAERDALVAENELLRGQKTVAEARASDLEILMGSTGQVPQGIPAGVLARPPVSPYDVLIVDEGATSGVAVGQRVTAMGGIPIGIVSSVTDTTARITLFTLNGAETAGWAGANRVPITLVGESAGAFTARITKGTGLVAGDGVYVVAGGAVPVGVVTAIEDDPSSPDAMLLVRPYVNTFSITMVSIETGS